MIIPSGVLARANHDPSCPSGTFAARCGGCRLFTSPAHAPCIGAQEFSRLHHTCKRAAGGHDCLSSACLAGVTHRVIALQDQVLESQLQRLWKRLSEPRCACTQRCCW
jgi:hypothetical protein